uniref:Synaptobrevin, longin-like domain protein n=1 Tax=Tanacetum cinerariifolium TaxID=118510 RepID=A0A699JR46_TANCI|nr:hypothetical protein [Tanacetum cinerariifolium]
MVACLNKSNASEGFNQVIDFINGRYIKYTLTVNPNIYVSCIKQFWNNVVIKQDNDVTRLQALVNKKKVVVTEAAIREVFRLADAEGVDCLPNKEIFAELACMGYEKPSTKLTFYKAFFSSQWKFLIHTILQSMSAKRTSWNEFSSVMASAVICLSTGELPTHTIKYTSPALTQNIFANMRRVGKGFSRVKTPLFEGMIVGQVIKEGGAEEEHVEDDTTAQGDNAQEPSIPTPTPPTPPLQQPQDIPSTSQRVDTSEDTMTDDASNQGRKIDELDKDDAVALMDDKEEDKKEEKAKEDEPAEVQERRKLNEEVEDLKRHLEIVPNEDDDVYIEATPLARKVPVVDYEIIHLNNKPHYKIIRADGTHQLFVSFMTLLKNFDREDLESLWSLVKERFFTSKPNNFSDDFLLTTLGEMFEKPDGQTQV